MSKRNRKFHQPILILFRHLRTFLRRATRGLMRSLLQSQRTMDRRKRRATAGFVLPTVTMVMLVVVLLTVAITLRSMDRAKQAQYRRVDEAVLQAATPALDRAKAKIQYLLNSDPTLPRATPSDSELYRALSETSYTLADETTLQVRYDLDGGGIDKVDDTISLAEREVLTTAWKFPVDTDNNGKFDTWTLYGIYFRSPDDDAARTPLDARTPPYIAGAALNNGCEVLGSSSGLVGDTGWYSAGSKLKKSIFTYVVNTPIAESEIAGWDAAKYNNTQAEAKATAGFSALEYQQDVTRSPLNNNAVVYRDDLELAPGGGLAFRLNGRVITNSNLLATQYSGLHFFLVSAPGSCFFEDPENSKIVVGGEVLNGASIGTASGDFNDVNVHLFQGSFINPLSPDKTQTINDTDNQTVTNSPIDVLNDSEAFEARLSYLVNRAFNTTSLFNNIADPEKRKKALRTYFEDRTRRVPYRENATKTLDPNDGAYFDDTNGVIRPTRTWIYPTDIENGGEISNHGTSGFTELAPKGTDTTGYRLRSQNPETVTTEPELGNRILVGNNLPLKWYINDQEVSGSTPQYLQNVTWTGSSEQRTRQTRVQQLPDVGATSRDGFWEIAAGTAPKDAQDPYGGLRVVTSAGVYDRALSFLPPPKLDVDDATSPTKVIVGTYDDPSTTGTVETYQIVWPDTMPMSPPDGGKVFDNTDLYKADGSPETNPTTAAGDKARWTDLSSITPAPIGNAQYAKGDLRMRATVVYHYASTDGSFAKQLGENADQKGDWTNVTQEPIACVSSYYDPSTSLTAKNADGLPWNAATAGKSNNGIVYDPPAAPDLTKLQAQADLVFPDGRFVNPNLRQALTKQASGDPLTLSEQSAIDSTMCALGILDGTLDVQASPVIPHGAIRETSFLDARQIKANEADNSTTATVNETFTLAGGTGQLTGNYNLPLENRQPLEIRATVLDLNQLRQATIDQTTNGPSDEGNEYLLPYSGIIYASRDDALPDQSDPDDIYTSSTDSRLDPTRRPNGIMLINGRCLARGTADCQNTAAGVAVEDIVKEKGLTLVSDLPVYIKGQFNPHTREEFGTALAADWSNFYTRAPGVIGKSTVTEDDRNLDDNFACRANDPRLPDCTDGDDWRPATILADSVTVLSGTNTTTGLTDENRGFRFGFRNEGDFDQRNNAGNARIGYDLDADGSIDAALVSISEVNFKIDLNNDGDTTDTQVYEWQVTADKARRINGFDSYNSFVTNGLSSGLTFDTSGDGTVDDSQALCSNTDYTKDTKCSDDQYRAAGAAASSYFNNFVTPVQRRTGSFPEYVMEICLKLPMSACGPQDWVIGYDANKDDDFDDSIAGKKESELTLYDLFDNADNTNIEAFKNGKFKPSRMLSGTTAYWGLNKGTKKTESNLAVGQRYARRVAFARDADFKLKLQGSKPVMIGIADPGTGGGADIDNGYLECYGYSTPAPTIAGHTCKVYNDASSKDNQPRRLNDNKVTTRALWFRTENNTVNPATINYGANYPLWLYNPSTPTTPATVASTVQNPLLAPVLQIEATTKVLTGTTTGMTQAQLKSSNTNADAGTSWLMVADNGFLNDGRTTFDAVIGTGDVPSRRVTSTSGEFNGGLPNLVRLLENWQTKTIKISGSFIQFQRSQYATSPYLAALRAPATTPPFIFGATGGSNLYKSSSTNGQTPYFSQPSRNWGFDVGLLSQSPDLFAQKYTTPTAESKPSEFFREVSRSDEWVKTLLCAKELDSGDDAVKGSARPDSFCTSKTGG